MTDAAKTNQQLDLFGARCRELAGRVNAGGMAFVEAIDLAYSAAIWSGLCDSSGDDAVQKILADAFMNVRRKVRS